MQVTINTSERKFLGLIALLGLFAVPAQLYLAIENRSASITETIIRFFNYFTVQVNILTLVASVLLALKENSGLTGFFQKPSTRNLLPDPGS